MRGKKRNLVIIRVWKSNLKQVATGKVSIKDRQVGHISIETPNRYMSLWPQDIANSDADQIFGVHKEEFVPNAEKDIIYETGDSSYTSENDLPVELNLPTVICLYSLDLEAMEAKFDGIMQDKNFSGWSLIGNNLLLIKGMHIAVLR